MRRFLVFAALALALPPLAGCGDEPGPLVRADAEVEPAFICPLPERDVEPMRAARFDPARVGQLPDVGRQCELRSKSLHRLNRAEYNNAVRDTFGVRVRPADTFPTDQRDHGFDNIADVLSVSPILVEKYFEAARLVADAALNPGVPDVEVRTMEAENYFEGGDASLGYARLMRGNASLRFIVAHEGDYDVRVMAYGEQAGPEAVMMEITMGFGAEAPTVGRFIVDNTVDNPQFFGGRVHLPEGEHLLVVRFLNEYARPEDRGEVGLDRNLIIDFLEVEGPFNPVPGEFAPARDAILTCHPGEQPSEGTPTIDALTCAKQILAPLARRALRRPVDEGELDRFAGFVLMAFSDGQTFEDGLKLAFRALLLHPEFLFRVERDPDLDDTNPHLLGDHELATRLSFFLWSSVPDDRLLDLADEGKLSDPVVYENEVRRMIRDHKAHALVQNFGGQWLGTKAADDVHLDPEQFPKWNDDLSASAGCETEMLLDDLIDNGGTLEDLLLSRHTFLNHRLADHYGMAPDELADLKPASDGHKDAAFARVSLDGTDRQGLLTHTTVLSVTSHPNRTSPVLRGQWVLEQLLCIPPPPPPPNVEGLDETEAASPTTLREKLEQHRADPVCAACHVLMDPIGLGLENFGPDGRYRDTDNGLPIDASSSLFNQTPFNGPIELAGLIAQRDELPRCAVQQAMTYGTGQSLPDPFGLDACSIDAATEAFIDSGKQLDELFVTIASTAAFKMRRADPVLDAEAAALDEAMGPEVTP
jgi:hypothetical protein